MAQSFKVSPFTSLGTPNNVLSDDYVHGTFETIKLKGSTTNGGKLDYKIKINASKSNGKISADVVDEGKIQFPVCDKYTVQLCQRRKGDLRAHVDFGQHLVANKSWNFFSNLKTNVGLQNFRVRFGANYFGSSCESNTRVEFVQGDAAVLTHRNYIKKGNHYYGGVFSVNLSSLSLVRYDALVGLTDSKYEVNLKHESDPKNQSSVGTVIATGTYFHDADTKAALEVKNKGSSKFEPSVAVGVQRKLNSSHTVKAKLDNSLNLALASKYAINNQFTLTAGALFALGGSGKCCDNDRFPPFPLGFQLDVNV